MERLTLDSEKLRIVYSEKFRILAPCFASRSFNGGW